MPAAAVTSALVALAIGAPVAFAGGVAVGWRLSKRWRLERRADDDDHDV